MTPVRQQRLTLALLLSLLLHLTTLVAPGWVLPAIDDSNSRESLPQIEAHLSTATLRETPLAPAQPPPVKRKPRQNAVAGAAAIQPSVVVEPPAQPALPPPLPQPQQSASDAPGSAPMVSEPAAPAAVAPPELPLPRHGLIRFVVTRGEQGFVIGQSVHRWSHDGKTYTLNNVTETTGLAALFRPVQVTQTSVGEIGADGLRPREFRTGKDGVAGDAANFDWSSMTLLLSAGNPPEVALKPGAQDMLSMFYQLSARYPWIPPQRNEVTVATGRKSERYAFEVLGEELLPTVQGPLRTLHLRTAAGVEAIDIWVGLDLRDLPVKIRYTDRQGDSFDQIAEEIRFDGMQGPGAKP